MSSNNAVTFSAREMEVLALAWQCMESQPKIDMIKLARLTGYTTGSAATVFGNIKRKIKTLGDSLSGDGPATPKTSKTGTPKSTGKRGRKAAEEETPTKRQKKGGAKKEVSEDDDEDFSTPVVKQEEGDGFALLKGLESAAYGEESDF